LQLICTKQNKVTQMKRLKIPTLLLFATFSAYGHATFIGYDNQTDFDLAITGHNISTLDFDSLAAGTTITSGDTVEGVTFNYDLSGFNLMVDDIFDTTSAPNYLGVDDGASGMLLGGDSFTMSFASAQSAFGLYVHSADLLFDFDISLMTENGDVVELSANVDSVLADGDAYFIGLATDDLAEAFTSITLNSWDFGFGFNVDNLVMASRPIVSIPEPSSLLLLSLSLLSIPFFRRKKLHK